MGLFARTLAALDRMDERVLRIRPGDPFAPDTWEGRAGRWAARHPLFYGSVMGSIFALPGAIRVVARGEGLWWLLPYLGMFLFVVTLWRRWWFGFGGRESLRGMPRWT